MKLLHAVAGLSGVVVAVQRPLSVLDNSAEVTKIPTSHESAVMGRRILALAKLGTVSTIFPDTSDGDAGGQEARPGGMGGQPFGLMDYVADCEDEGNPTGSGRQDRHQFQECSRRFQHDAFHEMDASIPAGQTHVLDACLPFLGRKCPYNVRPEHQDTPDPVPYSAASLARFALFGHLEATDVDDESSARIAACYTAKHDDARFWLPGNPIHESEWMRLVVTHVYWMGGFGDRAYIGWIPAEQWKQVTRKDWEAIELPGEKKGWREESSVGQSAEL
ncbi:hypothetical protein E4U41_002867 [Claviceps citrina]|nr:hypothetical protein E4U41_002867 [Claviceps citrina]